MTSYQKNVFVGATVLGGLVILAWMILRFGDQPAKLFAESRMPIRFVSERADGLGDGSPITYRGVGVGIVKRVARNADSTQVIIEAEVDEKPPLPANVRGTIYTTGLLGATSQIALELIDSDPRGALARDTTLRAEFVGLNLLPPEFAQLAAELRALTTEIREAKLVEHIGLTVESFREQLDKTGTLIENTNKILGDEQMQADLRASVAKLKGVIEQAERVAANMEKFSGDLSEISSETKDTIKSARTTIGTADEQIQRVSGQINARLVQLAKILENFQSISQKIDEGKGTAGQLVNDPKLYQALVDSTRELNLTIADLRRLVEQWEQEGVSLKLK
jgi:phospholipid/cholesterol/gamma-HCH transport system substrate-binding protein